MRIHGTRGLAASLPEAKTSRPLYAVGMSDVVFAVLLGAVGGWVGGRVLSLGHLALLRRWNDTRRSRGEVPLKNLIRHPFEKLLWLPGALAGGLAAPLGWAMTLAAGLVIAPGIVAMVVLLGHCSRRRS